MENLTKEEQLAVIDYQSCLTILQHEDDRKAQLFSVFLILQGALFGIYGSMINNHKDGNFLIALAALFFSLLWYFVMERMKGFIDLRYLQGRLLEKRLGVLTTVTIELTLRENGKVTLFGEEELELKLHQRIFSISNFVERMLPILTGIIWLILIMVYGIS